MCKHCSVIVECNEKKQRRTVADAIKTQMDQILKANITEKIPAEILERVLRRALDFCDDQTTLMQNLDTIQICDDQTTLMQNLDTIQIGDEGHIYNCGEVLRELVNGSGNFERQEKDTLFNEEEESFQTPNRVNEITTKTVETPPTDEAVCVNNTGMQDSFDVGVTYIFDKHEEEDMLWVTDNLGTRREVLKERFKLPPEEEKKEKKEKITKSDSEDRDSSFADIPF
jgi:hypothetical protein